MNSNKKRIVILLTIIISLPLSLIGAASNSLIMGGFFGFILVLSIDKFVSSFKRT